VDQIAPPAVRAMTLTDIPAVVEIDRLSFPIPWSERSYRVELTENPSSHLFVAEDGQRRVAGYGGFWLVVDEAHISTLAVHPELRGRGIGELLLAAMLSEASRLGAGMATLEVRVSNRNAIQLYSEFGFAVVGRRPNYYRDNGEEALLMTLSGLKVSRNGLLGRRRRWMGTRN